MIFTIEYISISDIIEIRKNRKETTQGSGDNR